MLTDSKLLTSAAWDAQSLNELKTKAGKDPAAKYPPGRPPGGRDVCTDDAEKHA